jgi:hypothetical protein
VKIKKSVLVQKLGKSYVAYDNETSTMHELNEVAYLILEGLKKGKGKKQIIDRIIKEFSVKKEEASKDFDGFSYLLKKKDLTIEKE